MEKQEKKSFFRKNSDVIILLLAAALCSLFAFLNVFLKIDYRIYDMLLGHTRNVREDSRILIVDINDASIDDIGVWPWNRDIVADMLIRMKEFGAYNVVFDIEYLQKSAKALVPNAWQETQEVIERSKQDIAGVIGQFAGAAAGGGFSGDELMELSSQIVEGYVNPALDNIRISTDKLSRDNDEYFARTLQYMGNTWMTMNMRMVNELDDEEHFDSGDDVSDEQRTFMQSRRYAAERFLLANVDDPAGLVEQGNRLVVQEQTREQSSYRGFYPARYDFIHFADGLGVTNVVVDRDGTRRRIELLHHPDPERKFLWKEQGKGYAAGTLDASLYAPQLVFAPLLRYLDVQSLERKGTVLVLRDALLPGRSERSDIRIPLDESGCMYIKWSQKSYDESFRHVSALYLYELDRSEERIMKNISNLTRYRIQTEDGYDLPYYTNAEELLSLYGALSQQKDAMLASCRGYDEYGASIGGGIPEGAFENYLALRQDFYTKLSAYVETNFKAQFMLNTNALMDGENDEVIRAAQDEYEDYFDGLKKDYDSFCSFYYELKDSIKDSFCLIGNSATASTDLGVTPFSRSYANLGTHANVANTIIQQEFITPLPVWFGLAFAFVVVLVILLLIRRLSTGRKNLFAFAYVVLPIAVLVMLMLLFNIYVPLFVPALLVAGTYLAELAMNFIAVEKDRSTLRRGFSAYVAPEVVNQILKDPDKLSLGGENKTLTALFSDVKTFSGFTEMINNEEGEAHGAVRLVAILNEYLGMLSNAIMDNKGTIDKYVGDEIVSFFGAPLDDPFNAYNACLAGIKMKLVENEYNKKHFDTDHDIPMRLESRVGLNTGDMVVGNMGTAEKLNYTIMGNNVNLASRLEGTNKAYGSWIMCSESTWNAADSGTHKGLLVARSFDCVQVINVKKPVQLYNILGVRADMPAAQIEAAEIFNEGMRLYLNGRDSPEQKKDIAELKKAYALFEQAAQCYPADQSSEKFMERCRYFFENGLPELWDGVYVMKSK